MMICAYSIITNAQITINSEPSGAKVYREGEYVGTTPCKTTPDMKTKELVYDIDANKVSDPSKPPYSVEFTIILDGYEPATVYFEGKYDYRESGWGRQKQKYYIVQPKSYKLFAALKKDNTYVPPQPIYSTPEQSPQKELTQAMNANQPETKQNVAMDESSDVHWLFDSDPDGAKIFWKVNSSIPNFVKNTELLYLGKTPFNETKTLNIKGLNSENADLVEIEIEIVKRGYIKQNKTFRGSVLVELKEISWAFDLIEETPKKEEKPDNEIINQQTESEE